MAHFLVLVLLAFVTAVQCQGNSACAHWCRDNFPTNPGGLCTSPASSGTGPCYECGPLSTVPSKKLCTSVCVDTATDNNNCGGCGTVCAVDSTCTAGVCVPDFSCPPGFTDCDGACVNTSSDVDNCGGCGIKCPPSTDFELWFCFTGACEVALG